MANAPTQGVWLPNYLNACNSPYSTGAGDAITGNAIPTGLTPYKMFQLSFIEAQAQQAPSPSIEQCFEGSYMWVQVDSGATASNVQTGMAAFYKIQTASNSVDPIATVTDEANATAVNLFAGVFLNPITPGNWGVIFNGAGRVNCLFKSSLTNGSAAIGDVIEFGAFAGFDDTSATAVTSKDFGRAIVKPVANGTSPVLAEKLWYRLTGGL